MTILGIGIDILEINRLNVAIKKNNNLITRLFTNSEINYCIKKKNKINFFAKRYSAKESLVKALGTGFRNNINFKDIEIKNDSIGMPYLSIKSTLEKKIKKKFKIKKFNILLTMSDEKKYVVTNIILTK